MTSRIKLEEMIPSVSMQGEDDEETTSLREMLARAEAYVKSFPWCPSIVERYLGYGVGGVVAVFLFRFAKPIQDQDEWLWVIEGDVPSAYLVVDEATAAVSALRVYCNLMEDWANAVIEGRSLVDYFPVNAEPTSENAKMLQTRIQFIRNNIIDEIP